MSNQWRATVRAATVVLALALASGCATSSHRNATATGTPSPSAWRAFNSRASEFHVQYPSSWRVASFERVGTFTLSIAFFSDQAMSAPCHTSANGSMSSCVLFAVRHLNSGGTSIDWSNDAGLAAPSLFDSTSGTRTTIGGQPAKIEIAAADEDCTAIGGRISVTASIERSGEKNNLYVMRACINADRNSKQLQLVLRSLRSMRQM
jgi:hypothetical protein